MALEDFSTDEGCNVRVLLLLLLFFFFLSPCGSQAGKVLGWKQSAARPPATTCLALAISIKPLRVCKTQSLLTDGSQEGEISVTKLCLQIATVHRIKTSS